jgi:hypoxanthine phosphoribosyltransferase
MNADPTLLADVARRRAERTLLASRAEIEAALDRMALAISSRLFPIPPILLTVMNGGLFLAGQLMPRLEFLLEMDYVHISRYRNDTHGSSTIDWIRPVPTKVAGRTVLILDDVLDQGITLAHIVTACNAAGATTVLTAVLVDRALPRPVEGLAAADFVGITTTDARWLVGWGMDYHQYLRNGGGIYALNLDDKG